EPSTVCCDTCGTPLSHDATHRRAVRTDGNHFRALCAWHKLCLASASDIYEFVTPSRSTGQHARTGIHHCTRCVPSGSLPGCGVPYRAQHLRYRVAVRGVRTHAPKSSTLWRGGITMPRGRKTALTIQLTRRERQTLMAWQRSTTIPAGLARRGRIILLLA